MRDRVFLWDTDPCDTCQTGISKFRCFDGVRRCQICITALVEENGWGELKEPAPPTEPAPP